MSSYSKVITKDNWPKIKAWVNDIMNAKNPDFFPYFGTQVYTGRQGSGKTISAVKHVLNLHLKYPKAIIVSNLSLKQMNALNFDTVATLRSHIANMNPQKDYIQFKTLDQLSAALVEVNNDIYGVLYLVDEIHTYFNALDSKNIPMYVFTEISQQRKQRKLIVGTSQLFLRTAKPFREQCDNVIVCKTYLGFITFLKAYDAMTLDQDYSGKLVGTPTRKGWFFHTEKLRESFDTYQKVVSGSEQYGTEQRVEVNLTNKRNRIKLKA